MEGQPLGDALAGIPQVKIVQVLVNRFEYCVKVTVRCDSEKNCSVCSAGVD
jgi:hypothetical protein